ncbi:OmpA family protein [Chryseotalea sanaruensis]|nr:OmpA family protein [Chryseotalea sanaruensis]
MKQIMIKSGSIILIALVALTGCKASKSTKGAGIGAGTGAVIGGLIGRQSGNTAVGAIIGAGVGGATGALIGQRMDKQAAELKSDLDGATVERIGEGIKITFDSGLMFDFDSYNLTSGTKENLNDLAKTLTKYDDTDVLIEGHTDKKGSDEYNMNLSEQRARAVEAYLASQQVSAGRITTKGYGETQSISENDQTNRRVEVAIYANNKMKRAAKRGEL